MAWSISGRRVVKNGVIAHGADLTLDDVGYTAYFDPGLGRKVVAGDLSGSYSDGTRSASDFVSGDGTESSPKLITRKKLAAIRMDLEWVTLRASLVDDFMTNNWGGGNKSDGMRLEWVTCDLGGTVGDLAVFDTSWSAYRCLIQGQSDGGRVNGGDVDQHITECIFHDAKEAPNDHNDCLQNVGGNGKLYSLRSQYWQQAAGDQPELGSSCVQYGDFASGSDWYAEHASDAFYANPDNSNPMLRLYDGGLTENIRYRIVNCWFFGAMTIDEALDPDANRVLDRGGSNTTPWDQIEWSDNLWINTLTDEATPIEAGF